MAAKRGTAEKKGAESVAESTERVPLRACRSWAVAARQARASLCFILNDPHESALNRIRAAEVVLDRAYGRPAISSEASDVQRPFEDWLEEQGQTSML